MVCGDVEVEEQIDCPFTYDRFELASFMKLRGDEILERYKELGGCKGIADGVGSSLEKGLDPDPDSLEIRKKIYGPNIFPKKKKRTYLQLLYEAFQDITMIILLVAAIISLIVGIVYPEEGHESTSWIEGAAILAAVLLVTNIQATLELGQQEKFAQQDDAEDAERKVKIIRGGDLETLGLVDVLVGDVIELAAGDFVPADGVFIRGDGLTVDESTMTGEPEPMKKAADSHKSWMLTGTMVKEGRGHMLAVAVGHDSAWGRMMSELSTERDETPLQEKLGVMALYIGYVGLVVGVLVFIIQMIYWAVDVSDDFETDDLRDIIDFFVIAITIVVVAVPEGLPLAVVISLAYSMKQMWHDKILVRQLQACETMGGATDICSDKTGTLTENKMTVTEGWLAGCEFDSVPPTLQLPEEVLKMIHIGIATNTTAAITKHEGEIVEVGSATELALLYYLEKMGHDYHTLRHDYAPVRIYAFESTRKKSSVVCTEGDKFRVHCKGAPEFVLEDCVSLLTNTGSVVPLEEDHKEEILELQAKMAKEGRRTLAIATRVLDNFDPSVEDKPPEHTMTFVGLFGIEDPIREQVPGAVERCKEAGVTVRMVTGDNILTAKNIARRAGIMYDEGIAIEGPAFEKLTDEEIDELLPNLQVIARCSPHDKLRLVCRLKHHKQIVAVTGDGTNDAPALRHAHIGLAMGIAGTDVAKHASDSVILDDNFDSIVKAVSWGRCIFDNVRKFLQFQLTVNFSALVLATIGAVTEKGSPMRAIQLLWVNLIMDTMAALALGTEKPTPDLLKRPPINIQEAWLLSNIMIKNILGQGIYQIALLCFILYMGPLAWDTEDESLHHYTLIFNSFVWATLWNEINSRKVNGEQNVFEGMATNWVFIGVIIFTIVVQVLVVQFGGLAFQTAPLDIYEWIATFLIGLGSLPIGALIRLMPVPKYDGFGFSDTIQFSWPEQRRYDTKGRSDDIAYGKNTPGARDVDDEVSSSSED